jgi:CrcB protein
MIPLSHLLMIGIGGALGSMLRALMSVWIPAGKLPWGTVTANVAGSFVIGLVLAKLGTGDEQPHAHGFLAIGFCGGFTTFSSFSWQTLEHLRAGQVATSVVHVLISVLVCLLATWLGWRVGRL